MPCCPANPDTSSLLETEGSVLAWVEELERTGEGIDCRVGVEALENKLVYGEIIDGRL